MKSLPVSTNFSSARRSYTKASPATSRIMSPTPASPPSRMPFPLRPETIVACLVAFALVSQVVAGPSAAAATPSTKRKNTVRRKIAIAGLTHGPLIVEMEDGKDFIDKMVKAAHVLDEYSFSSHMLVYKKKGKVAEERSEFYFRKPRLIRVEITDGSKQGAVAVLRADGKVRAHLGGPLKFFTVTLDPHSDQLDSANEYPMVDSDFISLAEFLANWVKEGIHSRVSKQPIHLDSTGELVNIVEMYKENDEGRVLKRIFVDANSHLPVEWYDYRDGALWSKSVFTNLRINTGLKDTLFEMK